LSKENSKRDTVKTTCKNKKAFLLKTEGFEPRSNILKPVYAGFAARDTPG
jgi:hypothetical protein